MSKEIKVKFKNKSKDKTLHKCDFCGESPEDIWEGTGIEGQYCLEHFRLMHDDVEEFDRWYDEFEVKLNEQINKN